MMKLQSILFSLFLVTSITLVAQPTPAESRAKVDAAMKLIYSKYVDDVDAEEMAEATIRRMLKDLDPHSVYIPKRDVDDANEPLNGNFEGVGIQFNILFDTIVVVTPISGGPSEKLGILPGDKIVYIEDELVAGIGIGNQGVINRLRGEKGTEVRVKIQRRNSPRLLEFNIVRDQIPLFSMDASYMATPDIGYIKLNNFSATTMNEFRSGLTELKRQGMQSLILDLRGNAGGYLYAAYSLADEFLREGELVVYTEGKSEARQDLQATARGSFEEGKLVVLIDEGSASASEIVSGAVQDWDRGLVIGRRSFGKALVQRGFDLPDGSSIRLTIARYFTPTGRFIQKNYENGTEAYRDELNERLRHGELTHVDSIAFPDSLRFETPNGRTVYGGGGIMPDIFVPLDTTRGSDFFSAVLRKGVLAEFALNYVNKHRDELNRYSTVGSFTRGFGMESIMDDFVKYAGDRDIDISDAAVQAAGDFPAHQLKALIARNMWGTGAYFEVFNTQDDAFNTAVQVIEERDFKELRVRAD